MLPRSIGQSINKSILFFFLDLFVLLRVTAREPGDKPYEKFVFTFLEGYDSRRGFFLNEVSLGIHCGEGATQLAESVLAHSDGGDHAAQDDDCQEVVHQGVEKSPNEGPLCSRSTDIPIEYYWLMKCVREGTQWVREVVVAGSVNAHAEAGDTEYGASPDQYEERVHACPRL